MTLTIELTPELQERLEAAATAQGTDAESVLRGLVKTLPARKMTPQEIAAEWDEDDSVSVYARSGEDSLTIARRLRQEAEQRSHVPR